MNKFIFYSLLLLSLLHPSAGQDCTCGPTPKECHADLLLFSTHEHNPDVLYKEVLTNLTTLLNQTIAKRKTECTPGRGDAGAADYTKLYGLQQRIFNSLCWDGTPDDRLYLILMITFAALSVVLAIALATLVWIHYQNTRDRYPVA